MSQYRRLISYIYAYEGSVKGKNIGYAKIEIRGGQCRIQASVRHIYVGGGEIGVYLLTPGEELFLGRIFIRNGAGEYHTQINPDDIDGSGCRIDQCYGLTIHDVENAWQCWMTIWEDAVAQTAELELADVTAENQRKTENQKPSEDQKKTDGIEKNDKNRSDEEPEHAEEESEDSAAETMTEVTAEADAVTADDAEKCAVQESAEKPDEEHNDNVQKDVLIEKILEEDIPEKCVSGEMTSGEQNQEPQSPGNLEKQKLEMQADSVSKLMAGIRTAISGNGTASGFLSSAIRTVQNIGMERGGISEQMDLEDSQEENDRETAEPQKPEHRELEERLQQLWKEKQEKDEKKKPAVQAEPFPELENTAFLKELDRLERENRGADHLWQQLQRRYVRVLAFDYEKGCEILSIRPQDIGLLPREIWHYGNNSFLLHGYYNYRHLILARMNNPQGPYRYLLGVPGHYFSNEKYLASMFGFPHFVLARKQPDQDGRFGYWYTEIRL